MSDEKVVAQDAVIVDDEDGALKSAKGEFQDVPGEDDLRTDTEREADEQAASTRGEDK